MKKRYAAIAAISLGVFQALSMIGAVPATAAAPVVASTDCLIVNGTLFVYGNTENVTLTVNSTTDQITCDFASSTDESFDIEDVTEIVAAVEGILYFNLEDADGTNHNGELVAFPDVDYSIAALNVYFDASDVTEDRDEVEITVSDDEFDMNGVGGDVDYNTGWWFEGGAGDDSFDASDSTIEVKQAYGLDGDDVINGGEGDDEKLRGDFGNDKLYGNEGDDDLDCREDPGADHKKEADQCWGGDGDDDISANAASSREGSSPGTSYEGYDTVAPGDGDDEIDDAYVLYYGDSSEGVEISVSDGEVTSDAGDDDFDTVDAFVGSSKDDTFYGSGGSDSFTGGGGDDTVRGFAGNDALNGGGGNDDIRGAAGNDTIKGNGGDDLVKAGLGDDSVNGGSGDDVMYGGKGYDTLVGKAGSDEAWGGPAKDLCVAEVKDSCEYSLL